MKILFVLENYSPHIGGVEIVFKNLAEGLAKLDHEVNIVTHKIKNTKKFEILNKVKIHRVPCFYNRYWFTFMSIPKVLKLAKKVDIIHTTTYIGAFPSRVAAKILKKPSVITVHEILGENWQTFEGMNLLNAKLHQFLEKLIISLKFDYFISVSKSTKKNVLAYGIPKKKSTVIYNGVDYEFFNPKKYDGKKIRKKFNLHKNFVYMFYGRPGISKGVEFLIRAVPMISKKIKNSKLLLILSKDKAYEKRYNYILKLIANLKIKDKIILLEPVPRKELPHYIKATDCVIVPSITEGFGFTAAEACAMNKAVVASNTTSLPEVVSGKYVLVKPKNPEEIANGIELIYKNKVKSKKIKIFAQEKNIQEYLKIYRALIK